MPFKLIPAIALSLVAIACGSQEENTADERATPVTATQVSRQQVERIEVSIGRLKANSAPRVSAETAGRIVAVHFDAGDSVTAGDLLAEINAEVQQIAVSSARAELRRLQAELDNEQRRVRRLRNLAEQQSVAQDQLDEAVTRVETFEAQLEAAQARLDDAEYHLRQTRIVSPVSGSIEQRMISPGDFVSSGTGLFELVSADALRALLPLPEHLQDEVGIGQPVRLSLPARPEETVRAQVTEIRPMVGARSRAIELIVDLDNPGGWRPGGSVTGRVVLQQHEGLVVPPASVVRRPAGSVVYVVDGSRAYERKVETGLRGAEWIEITDGLEEGERVVVDGAGFLTDDTRIQVEAAGDDR